ncbi:MULTISPECIES: glycosyltransferase [unclassified Pseudactinotalea]|uniref:glycosyltransferase n=1 Tax=unclassified Pseudactinotalea TaxID=2649176 RepID=UPI00128CCA6A|nr:MULTISPECIES: glycosyltransferase [unclassified Pseudactinotalea]MPV50697.1 glycosyltransferase [Pseudactinotalea sp. HY160]QGH70069.1 glycosyltransferase [Pseudactinotalea sp. HY158]
MRWLVLGDIGRRDLYHVGDEAMAEVAVEALTTRGAAAITLVATHASAATELYGRPAVERVGVDPGWTVARRDEMLGQAAAGELDASTPLGRLDAAVAAADAVLISGGGNLNSRFGHHIDERAALTRLARRHGKPLVVAAQTIGPALDDRERRLVGEIIEYARAFAVRDDDSYRLALELGGEAARVHRISDDAILLSSREADDVVAGDLVASDVRYVAASFTADPGRSGLDRHDYLDLVATTLDDLSEQVDAPVLLVPHIGSLAGPVRKVDELSDASIVERSTSGRIRALPTMTARAAAAVTAGALLSVSTRYHPLVFATAQGVPAVGISLARFSTVRMQGALCPLGLGAFVLGPASWESVPAAARELSERRVEVRQWLEPTMAARREQQQRWWDGAAALADDAAFPAPSPAAPFPRTGPWAAPAARALALFDTLDEERHRVADLTAQLADERRRLRDRTDRLEHARRRLDSQAARARRAENRRLVRLADRLGDAARTVGRRRRPRGVVATRAGEPQPLLSVLVPIYNVEDYLDECLRSIVDQSLTDLEILLIDDGSTDASATIAERFAARDDRIRLVRQENQGLGAVRNSGVRMARGRYLTFVDSDDVVPRRAFEALVAALEASGADLATGGTARVLPDGSLRTRQWVRDLHGRDRHTTIEETPQLLRDFYTWNKAYRAEFWHAHGFRFREGVLFEDQPVITEILCRAASIDVVAQTTYHYRIRPDDSALTGTMYSLADVRSREQAIRLTSEALDTLGVSTRIRRAWWWTQVDHHFPRYLENTAAGDGPEYAAVVDMMHETVSTEDVQALENASAAHRALCHLALTTSRESVARYLEAGGASTSSARLEGRGGETVAALPVPDEGRADLPADLCVVSTNEQRLVALFDGHAWEDPCVLVVHARVGISQAIPPDRAGASVVLAFADGTRMPLDHTGRLERTEELPRPFGVAAWYVMRIPIDVGALHRDHPGAPARSARVEVDLTWGALTRSGTLSRRSEQGSGAALNGSMIPGTSRALELAWTRTAGVQLRAPAREVSAHVAVNEDASLDLLLHARRTEFDIVFVTVKAAGVPARRHLVRRIGPREYRVRVETAWLEPGRVAHLAALDEAGTRRNVHVSAMQLREVITPTLVMTTTPGARLQVMRPAAGE